MGDLSYPHTPALFMSLTPELELIRKEVEGYAREYGLDFFEVIFEILDYEKLNEVASYMGFPTRYPYWRFGMEYEQLQKSHTYGLQRIYEMVINNDPAYAYLLQCNNLVDQKLVMAHVYGHVDFFKNNIWFSQTNRKMMDEMANHGARVRRYMEKYGEEKVEHFLDCSLSLENLIDPHSPFIKRREEKFRYDFQEEEEEKTIRKLKSEKSYMDRYINPENFLESQRRKLEQEAEKRRRFPENPERDVLLFLITYAPLENWQLDVLSIIREEAYYFAPQAQTKIMNEGWACATGDSLVVTEKGLRRFDDLVEAGEKIRVDGGPGVSTHLITDFHRETQVPTLRITTRRGLTLEGAVGHRVLRADGSWTCLSEIKVGDLIAIACGSKVWPEEKVRLDFIPSPLNPILKDVAASAEASRATPGLHRKGQRIGDIATERAEPGDPPGRVKALATQDRLRVPEFLDEDLAYILGVFIGNGNVTSSGMGVTCQNEVDAKELSRQMEATFEVPTRVKTSPPEGAEKYPTDERWGVEVHSRELKRLLTSLGIGLGARPQDQTVPEAILCSPCTVVSAFLRGYFDAEGYAGEEGITLSGRSRELIKIAQLLLLNYGILSTQRPQGKGSWRLEISGQSAARFLNSIGFSRTAKRQALERYVASHRRLEPEDNADPVVSIEPGRADVFDITVETSHAYVANGFINHNSYWHSKIMTQKCLKDSEVIDYADHHSGTLSTRPGRVNPYKLGIELFRDIEDRWNKGKFGKEYEECDDLMEKRNWDKKLGLGLQKIFEVRKIYNDVTFIDAFLTEEFCREQKLFTYKYNEQTQMYEIQDRDYKKIKDSLLFSLTNFGQPFIYIIDANYGNRGELYLHHRYEGVELRIDYAKDTLRNLYELWRRPVHLETMVGGKAVLFSFDGKNHEEKRINGLVQLNALGHEET